MAGGRFFKEELVKALGLDPMLVASVKIETDGDGNRIVVELLPADYYTLLERYRLVPFADPENEDAGRIGRLAADDPWEHSREGLDDCCHFCGCDHYEWGNAGLVYEHWPECAWIEARSFLGREDDPRHIVRYPPPNPYREACDLCDRESTVEDHEYHTSDEYLAEQAAFDEYAAEHGHRAAMNRFHGRSISDAFPMVRATRGAIEFPKPD